MLDEPIDADAAAAPAWEPLDRAVVPLWILGDLLSGLFLLGLSAAGWLFVQHRYGDWAGLYGQIWIGLAALLMVWSLLVPPLAYRCWTFVANDELLHMRYGILFREHRIVPVQRMQHVDLTRGPVERLFGLATLVVFTAGNEGSAFRVPGLRLSRAQALRDRILRARGDGAL